MRIAVPERIAAIPRRNPAAPVLRVDGAAMGTAWRVHVVARPGDTPAGVRALVEARLAAIVAEMSQWEPQSNLSAFNRAAAGAWVVLPPDLATVVAHALAIAAQTDGAFDPTLGRLSALMGHGAERVDGPPDAAALDAALAGAGWRRLAFDPAARRLRQPGGLWLDLSGVGKGFAVDAVADALRDGGMADALVEIGGELAGRGTKPDGQPWWVDLELPPGCPLPPLRVALHELAVATSGDYVRGPHTLDPRSGRPLLRRVVSVSVLDASAMAADAWATALIVAGEERGPALAERHGLAARMIWQADGRTHEWLSAALRAMIDG